MTDVSIVSVIVAEDHREFLRFISATLSKKRDLQIICEVADGLEAVKKAEELNPDLILLDIGLPTLNGITAARLIRELAPKSKIIFVTTESSVDVVQEALNLGGWGYVLKAMAGANLLAALEAIISGKQFASSTLGDLHFPTFPPSFPSSLEAAVS
jgi:DNA-binding NarL/FixJ family response regulator